MSELSNHQELVNSFKELFNQINNALDNSKSPSQK